MFFRSVDKNNTSVFLNFTMNNIPERKKKLYEKPQPEITGVIKYENTPKYRETVNIN